MINSYQEFNSNFLILEQFADSGGKIFDSKHLRSFCQRFKLYLFMTYPKLYKRLTFCMRNDHCFEEHKSRLTRMRKRMKEQFDLKKLLSNIYNLTHNQPRILKAVQLESKRKNIFEEFIKLKSIEKMKENIGKKRRMSKLTQVHPKSNFVKQEIPVAPQDGFPTKSPPEGKENPAEIRIEAPRESDSQ